MDNLMKMIKAGLGLPPTKTTPEYALKMYDKGYNAALVDITELVAIIKQRYLDALKDPDVHPMPEAEKLYRATIDEICKTIINSLNYK